MASSPSQHALPVPYEEKVTNSPPFEPRKVVTYWDNKVGHWGLCHTILKVGVIVPHHRSKCVLEDLSCHV